MLDYGPGNNPDLFYKGRRVVLNEYGLEQFPRRARHVSRGTVVSPYPLCQCVTVKWDDKKTKDRLHVDFLKPVKE